MHRRQRERFGCLGAREQPRASKKRALFDCKVQFILPLESVKIWKVKSIGI